MTCVTMAKWPPLKKRPFVAAQKSQIFTKKGSPQYCSAQFLLAGLSTPCLAAYDGDDGERKHTSAFVHLFAGFVPRIVPGSPGCALVRIGVCLTVGPVLMAQHRRQEITEKNL